MKNRWIQWFLVAFAILMSACNEFLDELPSKNTSLPVETTEMMTLSFR